MPGITEAITKAPIAPSLSAPSPGRHCSTTSRQDQHEHQRDRDDDLLIGHDPRALVIVAGNLARPGEIGNLDHRPAEIEGEQRDAEMERRDPRRGEEHRHAGEREDQRAGGDPRLAPAPAAARAVAEHADQRVGGRAPDPLEQEDQPERLQRQAEILRVDRREVDRQRHLRGIDRHRHEGKGDQPGAARRRFLAQSFRQPAPAPLRSTSFLPHHDASAPKRLSKDAKKRPVLRLFNRTSRMLRRSVD